MESKIICAGFGGQGILSLGKFMVYAGMEQNLEVTWLPSYGPEMRGGTANCSVVLSDKPVASPLITKPNILIVMNTPSLDKFESKVEKGGLILVNSDLIERKISRDDVTVKYISANTIALELGSARSANIVMFGAYVKYGGVVSKDTALDALMHQFEGKKGADSIKKAFEAGYNL
ncbi:MAG: 2-oxoacid:acceptor oxidoreductase family protein [Clostridia bacterium]|nr:2-oxoacid:acceptor oxidoreductase family protein [Bacteroidales bacterium]MDD4832452.1 2-oxoacid:acceptor oxidoreductase family protein [Clostridia bacterium]